ncbi:GNAT family N-acetyltransferase [Streptomyces litmocidini]|uniref:GNAT family N-acetyltransferase n=1 Tax=Streptomyces litmocidini TaxID=67318 RepID=UPI0036FCBC17
MTDFSYKPTLTGDLVVLRPVTEADVPALLPLFEDPEVTRLTGGHTSFDEAALARWYGSRGVQDDRLDLAVVERATGRVVGEAVLNAWDPDNESCAFRIAFVPDAVGRGLGTEATRLIVGHGFEALGLYRIWLEVYAFNPRARRAYEKAGFRAEGVLRGALLWEGERVDATVMSVLAPEWGRDSGSAPTAITSPFPSP